MNLKVLNLRLSKLQELLHFNATAREPFSGLQILCQNANQCEKVWNLKNWLKKFWLNLKKSSESFKLPKNLQCGSRPSEIISIQQVAFRSSPGNRLGF